MFLNLFAMENVPQDRGSRAHFFPGMNGWLYQFETILSLE
jgi:hypothetical protein